MGVQEAARGRQQSSFGNGKWPFSPNRSHMNMDISRHTLSESDMGIEKDDKEMEAKADKIMKEIMEKCK